VTDFGRKGKKPPTQPHCLFKVFWVTVEWLQECKSSTLFLFSGLLKMRLYSFE